MGHRDEEPDRTLSLAGSTRPWAASSLGPRTDASSATPGLVERILFRKIELWVVVLLLLGGAIAAIWLSWRAATVERSLQLGRVDRFVQSVAGLPDDAGQLYSSLTGPPNADLLAWSQRFQGESGLTFNYAPGTRPDLGYVLINRYDGDAAQSVSELVDLNAQEIVHRWRFDVDGIWSDIEFDSSLTDLPVDHGTDRFRSYALLLGDGSLIVQDSTPLLRLDHCGRPVWAQGVDMFHHSIELDRDGNIWIPITIEPKTVELGNWRFEDNGIALVSPDGQVLFHKSISHILDENGLDMYVYGQGETGDDPIHLNDIQPVLADGAIWREGDVFLSLRNKSMLMLYRPETNKVLWKKIGPWQHQHDIDLLDNRRIAVFNNQTRIKFTHHWLVSGTNNWIVLDVVSGEVETPFREAFRKLDIRTPLEGLAELMSETELMVEETNYGRLVAFDRSGNIIWQFINRAGNGNVYELSWSRLVPRELGDAVREKIAEEPCNG